jgi:hypothetical protein
MAAKIAEKMASAPPASDPAWFSREVDLDTPSGPAVTVFQLAEGPHGAVLWDAALVLARHMLLPGGTFATALATATATATAGATATATAGGASVLDLSAGTGLLTAVACHAGAARVTATELAGVPMQVL